MKLFNLFAILFIAFSVSTFAETPLVPDDDEFELSGDEEEGSEEVEFEVRVVLDFPPAPRLDENADNNYADPAPGAPRAPRVRAAGLQDDQRVMRRRLEPVDANAAALQAIAQAVALIPPPPAFAFGANAGSRTLF